jgi:hypothetical protein
MARASQTPHAKLYVARRRSIGPRSEVATVERMYPAPVDAMFAPLVPT